MKIAVISDLHKMEPDDPLEGQRQGFRAVPLLEATLREITRRADIDVIAIGGDCVNRPDDLSGLREIQATLAAGAPCPVVAIPGNHDPAPAVFYSVFKPCDYLDVEGMRIIPFCDEARPNWNAERVVDEFERANRICANFDGPKIFLQHVPLFPSGAPGLRYAYGNADDVVRSMKRNGAVLSLSGHQHEGLAPYEHDGMTFVCAPALCEPPFRFLIVEISPTGLVTSETVSLEPSAP